jgi:CRISPR-associated protein Csb2
VTRFLCISVSFLDLLFHGKGDDEPEWPPSPMRLFQALLAGARTGCREREWCPTKADAFRWLESRPPPLIVAPAARPTLGCTLFVPNNDSDRVFDRQDRLTSKTFRPHRLSDGDTVYYLWPIEHSDGAAQILCREARHLLAFGWGIDQVAGNGQVLTEAEAAALPGRCWRAWTLHRPGSQTWRVPTDGSLDHLERVHRTFLRRVKGKHYDPSPKPTRFNAVSYISASTLPPRSYAVLELPEEAAFRQEDTARVAAMLRSLTCRSAQEDTHQFPGGSEIYVAGHTGHRERTPPRFSYLPLPTIGHEHADGMIRRLLIAEPCGGDGDHARWAQDRLRNAMLRDEDGNDRGVLLNVWRAPSKAMIGRYVSGGRTWSTVTPVILPGFDDGKHAKAEKLLIAAIRQADLPLEALTELSIRKAPFWPSSQHPRQYAVPAYLKHLPGWHVRLIFHEPLPGPLAIGAGRHAGLGVFARTDD